MGQSRTSVDEEINCNKYVRGSTKEGQILSATQNVGLEFREVVTFNWALTDKQEFARQRCKVGRLSKHGECSVQRDTRRSSWSSHIPSYRPYRMDVFKFYLGSLREAGW